jgi:hypothetical protein
MPQARTMTLEEEAVIALKAFELKKQGKLEEYERTLKQIPLQPYLAKFVKDHIEYFGKDFFEKYGWNLSAAEAEYGPDWIIR